MEDDMEDDMLTDGISATVDDPVTTLKHRVTTAIINAVTPQDSIPHSQEYFFGTIKESFTVILRELFPCARRLVQHLLPSSPKTTYTTEINMVLRDLLPFNSDMRSSPHATQTLHPLIGLCNFVAQKVGTAIEDEIWRAANSQLHPSLNEGDPTVSDNPTPNPANPPHYRLPD